MVARTCSFGYSQGKLPLVKVANDEACLITATCWCPLWQQWSSSFMLPFYWNNLMLYLMLMWWITLSIFLLGWNPCKNSHSKVNRPLALSSFTMSRKRHLYLLPKHFHLSKRKPEPIKAAATHPSSSRPWKPPICFLFLWIDLFRKFCINRSTQYGTFCIWLFCMHSRFIYCAVQISISLLFLNE